MKILAIDIGGGTGIAVDGPEHYKPLLIAVRLPPARDGEYGPGALKFWNVLLAAIEEHRPDLIAYERVARQDGEGWRGKTNDNAARQQYGRSYVLEMAAAKFGIPCEDAAVSTIRKHFVGHGRPKDAKRAVSTRCRQLGWRPPDHNCADAAALWSYFKSEYEPAFGAQVTPLMRHEERLS